MIKARACAGDIAAGEAILSELSPFVWRKYLDFAAVADVHAMKRQINAYRGHGEIAVEGHNIKLGRGGIREIEFFAQTQQLIAGGRNPELRDRDTLTTLDKLCDDRWIDDDARDEMKAAYVFLRTVEHRLQMVNDEQTQTLPAEREALERFARFLGFADRDAFAKVLVGHLDNVQRHYARLFEKAPRRRTSRRCCFPPDADDHKTLDRLAELGFRAPLEASAIDPPLARRRPPLAAGRGGARRILSSCCRCWSSSSRAPTIPTPRWCRSTISLPICTAPRGCCRCCGRIPS